MNKRTVVDITFSMKKDKYTVKLKALHNGSHLIEKQSFFSDKTKNVFEFASAFITKHEATSINLKRGLLEDSFAKYFTDTQAGEVKDENKIIEGILVGSVSEEHQEILVDLHTYKMCLDDTVRHSDYEGLIFQGILFNNARKELFDATGLLANPFEATVVIALSDKTNFYDAVHEINEIHLEQGIPVFTIQNFNRVANVESVDYKLTVHFE